MATYRQPPDSTPVCFVRHIHIALQYSLFIANGSFDTQIHRSHKTQLRQPCRYFREEPLAHRPDGRDKSDGSILELRNVISLRYSFYGGLRNEKILSCGEWRKILDCYIFRVNGLEVFL